MLFHSHKHVLATKKLTVPFWRTRYDLHVPWKSYLNPPLQFVCVCVCVCVVVVSMNCLFSMVRCDSVFVALEFARGNNSQPNK